MLIVHYQIGGIVGRYSIRKAWCWEDAIRKQTKDKHVNVHLVNSFVFGRQKQCFEILSSRSVRFGNCSTF